MKSRTPGLSLSLICALSMFCQVESAPANQTGNKSPGVTIVKAKGPDLTPAYNAYLNQLRAKVLKNWDLADGRNHVVLETTVSSDGSASDFILNSSPKNEPAERAASAALSQAQPLAPLPKAGASQAKITLTFDSNSDPHGDSNSSLGARLDPIKSAPQPASEATSK